MDTLIRLIADYGLVVVFVNILVQQLGAPVPSYGVPAPPPPPANAKKLKPSRVTTRKRAPAQSVKP